MAIIKCEVCGKQYSDKAGDCPFCTGESAAPSPVSKRSSISRGTLVTWSVAGLCLLLLCALFTGLWAYKEGRVSQARETVQAFLSEEVPQDQFAPEQQRIMGAFGMQLGAAFSHDLAIGKSFDNRDIPLYEFMPKNPLPVFSIYAVQITPQTRRIYSIQATTTINRQSACTEEAKVLLAALGEKYGNTTDFDDHYFLAETGGVHQGSRRAWVTCSGSLFDDTTLTLEYIDTILEERSEKERIVLKSKQMDTTGL